MQLTVEFHPINHPSLATPLNWLFLVQTAVGRGGEITDPLTGEPVPGTRLWNKRDWTDAIRN